MRETQLQRRTAMKIIRTNMLALIALLVSGAAFAQGNSNPWQDSFILESKGQFTQSISSINSILNASPNNEFALMRRAWLNYRQGQFNEALNDYKQVLSINPKSLEARLGLTLPLMAQLRWREAAVEAHKVIEASAWDYTAHARLMICEEALHNWADLSRHAGELSAHYPSDATALVYLARAEAWQKNIKEAKSAYSKVLERIPGHFEATAYIKANP
jgi:tetratricopeptide (TPR) repeat protein